MYRCQCCLRNKQYQCRVSNEVDANEEWSSNYRCIGKQFQSEIISKPVDITSYYESLNSGKYINIINYNYLTFSM